VHGADTWRFLRLVDHNALGSPHHQSCFHKRRFWFHQHDHCGYVLAAIASLFPPKLAGSFFLLPCLRHIKSDSPRPRNGRLKFFLPLLFCRFSKSSHVNAREFTEKLFASGSFLVTRPAGSVQRFQTNMKRQPAFHISQRRANLGNCFDQSHTETEWWCARKPIAAKSATTS